MSAEARFEAMYREYHRQVYAYFRRRTDLSGARDCAAETFLVAWRRIDDVPEGERALPWLYGTARKVLANHRRSLGRFSRLVQRTSHAGADPPDEPETVVVRREEDQEVIDALARLRPADRELLCLAIWEEVPRETLAEMQGCSTHALNQRIYRAGRRLARLLPPAGHRPDETAPDRAQGGAAR
jgi:RNA polymerase sigma-70 factor (ECF subfamily)